MFKTAQVQVWCNWNISIRYSEKNIDDFIELDKEWNLINGNLIEKSVGNIRIFVIKNNNEEKNIWYTLYYMDYNLFISQNWTFESLV